MNFWDILTYLTGTIYMVVWIWWLLIPKLWTLHPLIMIICILIIFVAQTCKEHDAKGRKDE